MSAPVAPRRFPVSLLGAVLLLWFAAAGELAAQFTNVTSASGISYIHTTPETAGARENYNGLSIKTPFSNLAGASALDVNGDGWTDLIAARANQSPVLYVNQGNGTFTEQAAARGLGEAVNAAAFCGADLDNDGDVDLFVVLQRASRFHFYINDGTGNFTEQAVARGADVTSTLHQHQGYSFATADYDRDGYLDLYVCEWGIPFSTENSLHSVLLRNRGASAPGHFDNVTAAAGLVPGTPNRWSTIYDFAAAWADFDDDGWPDLYVVGDLRTSRMYWNNGNGTFTEGTVAAGLGLEEAGMGVAVGDYDNDGRLDLFVTSIYDQYSIDLYGVMKGNKLYQNAGNRNFAEVANALQVDKTGWAWGAAYVDFNNDSRLDLLIANGMDAAEFGPFGSFYDALTDQTALMIDNGIGYYQHVSSFFGITDQGMSKAVVVLDYDRDGDEDYFVTNTFGGPILYRNDAPEENRRWIRFQLQGGASNRAGIGAVVRVTEGGKTQTKLFNPTNNYIGQHEAVVHFGLGAADATADAIEVRWPSGAVQQLAGLLTNQLHVLAEPVVVLTPPVIDTQPALSGALPKNAEMILTVVASGNPPPVYLWEKDGVAIAGATGPTLRIARIHPFDAGTYRVRVISTQGTVASNDVVVNVTIDVDEHSVARWWNEFLLDAIRRDVPNPPVHARNLYHLSAAMWDAFWPYQEEGWSQALPVFIRETVAPTDWSGGREAAQRQAISHAAYRVLTQRFANSPGAARSLYGFRWLMQQYGFDPDFTGITGNSPAAVGNRIGYGLLAANLDDGANEAGRYADITGYTVANDPMIVALEGATMENPNLWQPLALEQSISQNGIPLPENVQQFVGVNALYTRPFALVKPTPTSFLLDPGPPPRLGTDTEDEFILQAVEVLELSSWLDPTDGVTIDISPGARFKNPLGSNGGTGYPVNPVTGQPYAPNIVKRADYARVLAEFWADGPESETPPGHWNVVHNEVTDHPAFERRFAGQGPLLSPLEWDVRAYLALNGAVHDAACIAWGVKHLYNSARPISMIRYLAGLGQMSDPNGPSYHPQGLPLVPGLIEVITAQSSAPGQRHAHLAEHVGKIAARAWRGNPIHPESEIGGVGWILAAKWVPYQKKTFVSPAFPGFISGHSTFSRAAAEVLTMLTGSPYFPGGLGEYTFKEHAYLAFETGPTADLKLQWATYYDAADQAGLSRLLGGIHIAADDFHGRRLGARVGLDAFNKAQHLRYGALAPRGLTNISGRGQMGEGENSMIAGFVIGGDTPQDMLVRAIGPELQRYGLPAELCEDDPSLALFLPHDQAPFLANDDWGLSPRSAQIALQADAVSAFSLAAGGTDAAELATLAPGLYTVVTGTPTPQRRGIALAEVYGQHLLNVSLRGRVGVSDRVLIAGFYLGAHDVSSVLIRGIGPSLQPFGVVDVLADPVITVFRQNSDGTATPIASNDDWSTDDRASLAQIAMNVTAAFALPVGSKDAALFLQLPPGGYTVVVSGAGGSEGVALAEVYHVQSN